MKYVYEKIDDNGKVIDRISTYSAIELVKSIFQYEKLLYELLDKGKLDKRKSKTPEGR